MKRSWLNLRSSHMHTLHASMHMTYHWRRTRCCIPGTVTYNAPRKICCVEQTNLLLANRHLQSCQMHPCMNTMATRSALLIFFLQAGHVEPSLALNRAVAVRCPPLDCVTSPLNAEAIWLGCLNQQTHASLAHQHTSLHCSCSEHWGGNEMHNF